MPKRRCSFNPKLKTQFPNLRDADEIGKVLCTECKSVFSIEHGGISDIKQHLQKRKHVLAVSSSGSANKLASYFINGGKSGLSDESKRIAAEEGMFAFHTIMHNHSFRSMDCTPSLIKKIHDKKFSCARTKCELIISKVIAPFAMEQVLEELKNTKFATLMVDTSNHKNLKLVPILIRYFNPKEGVQIKILEFTNLQGETADILTKYIMDVLKKYNLSDKIVAFSGDNCNTNFGGVERKGIKNGYAIINENLKTNISGIGCAAHILHNAMQTCTDILPIDIQSIVNKIFQFFHIYTVRVEQFKEFCDFVNVEFKNILGTVKTRWLSLLPAVTRILDLFPALKTYFLTQDKCPTILKQFFDNPVSIAWLYFIQSQLKVVCDTITIIESDNISASEVYEELEVVCGKIRNRQSQQFFTSKLALIIEDLDKKKIYSKNNFIEKVDDFYSVFLSYVKKRSFHFEPFKIFRWTQLLDIPTWVDVQESIQYLFKNKKLTLDLNMDEDKLFDEYNHVIHVIQVKIVEWRNCSKKVTEKWCEVFKILEKNQISINNLSTIIEYSLAIPGTNASVERIFSITNVLWTDEKNRFKVETIRSIIIAKQHFKSLTCSQFYEFLLKHPKLLNLISSSEKYEKIVESVEEGLSNS